MLVLRPPVGHRTQADELAFASSAIAAPGDGVILWTAFADGTRAERVPLPDDSWASRLVFAPDGRTLFAGNDRLYALDIETRGPCVRVPVDQWHTLGFGVSPDGARLVVSEQLRGSEESRLTCWEAAGGFAEPVWQLMTRSQAPLSPLFPPGGDRFVQVENTREPAPRWWHTRVVTRSMGTGAMVTASDPFPEFPERVALSPDGATLAARIRERIYVGPVAGDVTAVSVANDSKKHFTGIAFHPSGRYLAATSNDSTVKLYDTATWQLARTFTWDVGRMRSIAFSPDGTLAAAGSDTGKVVVWDVDL